MPRIPAFVRAVAPNLVCDPEDGPRSSKVWLCDWPKASEPVSSTSSLCLAVERFLISFLELWAVADASVVN